ncbi:CDGSH iron-sulfur domain-containing protein [Porticoccus sp.]
MATPEIGGTAPVIVEVTEGKTYWWCACGRSATQPFCDGSHAGTEFTPLAWQSNKTGKAAFCTCKRTGTAPLCDGTHTRLEQE